MHFRLLKNTNQTVSYTHLRWERNRTLSTLNAMDDRLLQDIGLNRKDIPQHIRDMESFSRR